MTSPAQVPVRECGEALLDVAVSPVAVAVPTLLRCGVVDRLVVAQSMLPRDVRLLVVDGYRPAGAESHPTGGAVDLVLSVGGAPPATLPRCGAVTPGPPPTAGLLVSALTAAGLVNDPVRWWHWSYGDAFWALVSGAPHARYGPVPHDA